MSQMQIPEGVGTAPRKSDPFRYGWRFVKQETDKGTELVQVPLTAEDVLHPQEDDFIVQTDYHVTDCCYLREVLIARAEENDDLIVLHDHRVDWEVEGVKPHGPDIVVFSGGRS